MCLCFLASGAIYSAVCDTQGVDKATVCRSVRAVVSYLNSLQDRYIKWPKRHEFPLRAREFFRISHFPSVVGAVDGTHMPIRNPTKLHNGFYNRKGFTSINVMVVCNADLTFSYIDANFPGSANDAFVMKSSPIHRFGEHGRFDNYVLLGDSGYAQRDYVMTPFLTPNTRAEAAYNMAHIRTRCTVERSIGVLKQRFRCLDQSAGYLMSDPGYVADIVVACAILHNMAIRNGLDLDLPEGEEMQNVYAEDVRHNEMNEGGPGNQQLQRGLAARARIVQDYFGE